MPLPLQEDVVHQVAVRIPLEEIVKICSKPATAARFTEEVEHIAFPEDEFSAVAMDVDAGASPFLDEGFCWT